MKKREVEIRRDALGSVAWAARRLADGAEGPEDYSDAEDEAWREQIRKIADDLDREARSPRRKRLPTAGEGP